MFLDYEMFTSMLYTMVPILITVMFACLRRTTMAKYGTTSRQRPAQPRIGE